MRPPAGVWRKAFENRFTTTWRRRSGSPSAGAGSSAVSSSSSASAAAPRASATAVPATSARSTGPISRRSAAASAAASVSRSPTRPVSRSTSSWSERRVSASGSSTPSTRPSVVPRRIASGVRTSCATSRTSCRRRASSRSTDSDIRSKAAESTPSSPGASLEVDPDPAASGLHLARGVGERDERAAHARGDEQGDADRHGDRDQRRRTRPSGTTPSAPAASGAGRWLAGNRSTRLPTFSPADDHRRDDRIAPGDVDDRDAVHLLEHLGGLLGRRRDHRPAPHRAPRSSPARAPRPRPHP